MAYGTGMPPNGSGAPPFAGPTPPDRVAMSLQDHLNAALAIIASRPPMPQEMQQISAFSAKVHQLISGYAGVDQESDQQDGEDMQQAAPNAGEQFRDGGQDYGEAPGTTPALTY